jgi:hypothetical protein
MSEAKTYIGTYKVVKIYRSSHKRVLIERNLSREQAQRLVNTYPDKINSMVVFEKQFTASKFYI